MQKQFLRLLHLGQNTFWQLLQETNAAGEEQLQTWQQALQKVPLHVWLGDKNPQEEAAFLALLEAENLSYTLHDVKGVDAEELETLSYEGEGTLNIACGFNETELFLLCREKAGAWFNGMSESACPWGALAEAAFNVELTETIDSWRICWLGPITPVSQSLMEAGVYTPYEFFMGIPSWSDPHHSTTDMALKAGAKVFMTREPRLALDDAHIIYMDPALESMTTSKTPSKPIPIFSANDDFVWEKGLSLNEQNISYAMEGVRIVTTEPNATYKLAEVPLQQRRQHLQRTALLCTLHFMLSE